MYSRVDCQTLYNNVGIAMWRSTPLSSANVVKWRETCSRRPTRCCNQSGRVHRQQGLQEHIRVDQFKAFKCITYVKIQGHFAYISDDLMSDETCIGLGSAGEDEEKKGKRVDQPGSHPSFEVTLWKFRFDQTSILLNVSKVNVNSSNC